MLAAVLHGKVARVKISGQGVSWRELFSKFEDLLTAAFFGRYLYLSPVTQQQAVALLVGDLNAAELGDVRQIVFWPSLYKTENDCLKRVEPDLMIECEKGLVMVEVKAPWGHQDGAQWHNEVKALRQTFISGMDVDFELLPVVHFVALGQNGQLNIKQSFANFEKEPFEKFETHQREWDDVVNKIDGWAQPENNGDRAVIADWRSAFELFGLSRPIKSLSEFLKFFSIGEEDLSLLTTEQVTQSVSGELIDKLSTEASFPWLSLISLAQNFSLEDSQ